MYAELERALGDWVEGPPVCERHGERAAAGFCSRCRRPVCGECLVPLPGAVRCRRCRPWGDRRLPVSWIALGSFLRGTLRRRWALAVLAFAVVMTLIGLLMPNVLRPRSAELPDWLRQSTFRAPRLHQAYRLAFAGDQFVARGDADRAQGYYRRAERTALDYLDRHPDAPHTWQVLLGIGRLRQKQGRVDEALETFDTVLRQVPADMPAYGVAHYYCGLIYENERKDPARALEHYRSALESAESGDDFLEQLIRFYATERVEKRDLYAVASLTQTVTSAAAVVDKLAAAVERCEAGAAEERPAPQDAAPEAARRERIEFIPGD